MNLGVIGGSGLYSIEDGGKGEMLTVDTPFGPPSSPVFRQTRGENTLFFLARHGKGHVLLPSEVNYRANLYALKSLGVRTVISVSAVGSLRCEITPGDFVLPTQYIDRTQGRQKTFFGRGIVAHAHFADPVCATLRAHLAQQLEKIGAKCHEGGTYVCMEGPQFSTRAESHWYRSWEEPKRPISVIGMTALPEANLARELAMCYQTVAMATDFDCWNETHGDVDVAAILATIGKNVSVSRRLISQLFTESFPACRSGCPDLMKTAVLTPKELWPNSRRKEMEVILG